MDSVLRCLTHTVSLIQGLRSCIHDCSSDAGDFCAVCSLLHASLAPREGFLVNRTEFAQGFEGENQEDPHEFMLCLLNKLQCSFPSGDKCLVDEIFGGLLGSKLRCICCGHCSETCEKLMDLSLEVENMDTLEQALESFTNVEKIDGNLTCAGCNEDQSMEKQLMFTQTPSVLAFHLKRFESVQKNGNFVSFTLELDLKPYTSGAENDNVELKYDLYAVVVHSGSSPNSGHYFCFVRSAPDNWHRIDDSEVTSVSGDVVLAQEPHILFYARQGTPWFSSIMEPHSVEPSNVKVWPWGDPQKIAKHRKVLSEEEDFLLHPYMLKFVESDNEIDEAVDMLVENVYGPIEFHLGALVTDEGYRTLRNAMMTNMALHGTVHVFHQPRDI